MAQGLFANSFIGSPRIIYTPSSFARSALIHLQETGTLQATYPHKSERSGLSSFLFFMVVDGEGRLTYDGEVYELRKGDCVFIDCKKAYSHETGRTLDSFDADDQTDALWSLQWCHFYGPNMNAIYHKYQERGGRPVFRTGNLSAYRKILDELYQIAGSDDYVRDMRIHERLSSLLILLMEDAWQDNDKTSLVTTHNGTVDIQSVRDYLDSNFTRKITLDELSDLFYINKYYLLTLFKERYGVTINVYLNQVRVTYVKQQLRFTDKTVEALAMELNIESTYLSRLFKKVEGMTPSEYRRQWN